MTHLQAGQSVPDVPLFERRDGTNLCHSKADLFDGQTTVLFALPGAFTPTCSNKHVPGYEARAAELKAAGVDRIICLSVNDAWVMEAWGRDLGVTQVQMIGDGNGDFSQAMGLLKDNTGSGFGHRSARYSMVVRDGVIEQMFVEEKGFKVSDADTLLAYLQGA